MQKPSINVWLLTGAAILSLAPVLIHQGKEFKATDSINVTAIEQVKPGYKPWLEPIIKPSGGEVETFLFATQAAIGSGVTCYILGLYKGRTERRKAEEVPTTVEYRD
ncbi:energy-coupling factor ABC transporter substrate-binding protein [Chamaesiphon minutus]|uniref:Cobalt transport protein CbiN n=1 Tax=Chamaesiphon minutus (strain ATCC 27169 / PCC 6605) TaxID=1173020 RepID=K9UNL2_CHAP6|nr:energy-coupling factor ABC transporter substrate-binding protein [Chamaesiphon minutus]AFY96697.1 ABC-type cobalt transport system, periplasmic component [Chamaesiphon minutus PCC 6605]